MNYVFDKKLAGAIILGATITLAGCAGSGAKDGVTQAESKAAYEEYLENPPSFEFQSVGDKSTDLIFSAIAGYAEKSYMKVKAIDEATKENQEGYVVQRNIESKEGEELEAYTKALSPESKEKHSLFVAKLKELLAIEESEKEEMLKAALGVATFDKDKILGGANMMQKLKLGKSIASAVEQANYTRDSIAWFEQYEGILVNAENYLGK